MARVLWLGWTDSYTPRRIHEAADQLGLELTALQVDQLSFVTSGAEVGVYFNDCNLVESHDVLVARTNYPNISEVLTVARLFHDRGKPVVDQALVDEGYVISKMHDYLVLAEHGLPVPRTWQVFTPQEAATAARALGYPCVLKGAHGSHGSHVYLVGDEGATYERYNAYPPGELLLQEYIPAQEDYRILVIGYHALDIMVCRKPAPGDFRTNNALNGGSEAHRVSDFPALTSLAEEAARTLRREFAGLDIRYNGDKPYILEVNRQPVFENFEWTTGMDVAGLYLSYVAERVRSVERVLELS